MTIRSFDPIMEMFGRNYRDEPDVRLALEDLHREFMDTHNQEEDRSETNRQYILENIGARMRDRGDEYRAKAQRRGLYIGRRLAPSAPVPQATSRERSDGSVVIEFGDRPEVEYIPDSLRYDTALEPQNFTPLPGKYGDPRQHPGYREEREMEKRGRERLAHRLPDYAVGVDARVEGHDSDRRRYIDGSAVRDGFYGDPRSFPPRADWKSR